MLLHIIMNNFFIESLITLVFVCLILLVS